MLGEYFVNIFLLNFANFIDSIHCHVYIYKTHHINKKCDKVKWAGMSAKPSNPAFFERAIQNKGE